MRYPRIFDGSAIARMGAVLAAVLLTACARVSDGGWWLVSSGRDAYLLVNGELLTGTVTLVPDRSGRASFTAGQGAVSSCSGGFRYTATLSGEMHLRCGDGSEVALQYTHLSETRGYGYGATAAGVASLAFGMSPADAMAVLRPPQGKTLVLGQSSGALELQ